VKGIAVLFGGRSSEHEISIITALQLIEALDVTRYQVIPVYIDLRGRWFTGEELLTRDFYKNLPANLSLITEVTLLPYPGVGGLTIISGVHKYTSKIIPVDVFFPAFHGQFGEDGCIQGLFELAEVPYTGCGVVSSSVAMNKDVCKAALKSYGVPVLPGVLVSREEAANDIRAVEKKILATRGLEKFPLFVKPCSLGSSVGISRVTDSASLAAALAKAFRFDTHAIIEPCVTNKMEINISVVGGNPPTASVVEIPVASAEVLTYEDKYMRGAKSKKGAQSSGMASLTRKIDPEDLDPKIKLEVTAYAINAFKALDCGGVVRFDFMYDLDKGNLTFNELNPLPGSLSFYLWIKSKPQLIYTDLLDRVIAQAEHIHQRKLSLNRETGFRAMFS